MPVNLLDSDTERLAGFFAEIGEKPFRARQVMRWIHRFGQAEFEAMPGTFDAAPRDMLRLALPATITRRGMTIQSRHL